MENNNEQQKSTEQLYSNIEGTTIELPKKNVEEEPSYSLEDLHPEEKEEVKEVAPAASSTEEIQPDPTVIDGKKETIGDQSSFNEVQPQSVVQPAPQPEPVKMSLPVQQPVVPTQAQQPIKQKKQEPEEPSAKLFYAIFIIILLLVVVGLPLYSSLEKYMEENSGTSEPIKEQEPVVETKPVETPTEPTTPQEPAEIVFDMSLEFDKGFVTNEKEINQKAGYLPTNLNGVIRCDLEKPMVMQGITTYASTYLHYENYELRSAITVTKQVYSDQATYMNTKDATLVYKNAGDKYDTLDVLITQDDESYTVTNIMHYHLMYGHTTYIDDLDTNILFSSQYTTNIKKAIDNAIVTGMNNGNTVCGTLNTENTTA